MYSMDRRKLAAHVYSIFNSLRKTAMLLKVSHSSVARWILNPEKKQYDASNRKLNGKTTRVIVGILAAVKSDPLISTRGLATLIEANTGVHISRELARCVLKNNTLIDCTHTLDVILFWDTPFSIPQFAYFIKTLKTT